MSTPPPVPPNPYDADPAQPGVSPYGSPGVPLYVARPATGALSWALGFLAYIPIPFLSIMVAGIVMAAVYPGTVRKQPQSLAAANARSAANWGLTLITVMLAIIIAFVVLMATLADRTVGFFPIGSPLLVYVALCVAHLVVTIVGTVTASRGSVFRNPIAIPYLR